MKHHEDPDAVQAALEKVVDFAIQEKILAPTDRKKYLGQAMIHHGDKRAFLRKLIERKGGLTTDEGMRLEKEALAPPPPPPPSKPIPKLHEPDKQAKRKKSHRMVSSSPLPSLSSPKKEDDAPKPPEQVTVYKRGLPNLRGPAKKKGDEGGEETSS